MHAAIAAIRTFFLLFVVTATAIGIGAPLLVHTDNSDLYISMWGFTDEANRFYPAHQVVCDGVRHRMYGSSGTAITAVVLQGLALLLSFADIFHGPGSIYFFGIIFFHFISVVLGLVAWAIALSIRNKAFCGTYVPADNGMKIAYGLALLIAAWCVQIVLVTGSHLATMPKSNASAANKEAAAEEEAAEDKEQPEGAVEGEEENREVTAEGETEPVTEGEAPAAEEGEAQPAAAEEAQPAAAAPEATAEGEAQRTPDAE